MAQSIAARLQTPEDSNGNRTDIHLITTADQVIVNAGSEDESMTLTEALENLGSSITISRSQPSTPCIWAKPVD